MSCGRKRKGLDEFKFIGITKFLRLVGSPWAELDKDRYWGHRTNTRERKPKKRGRVKPPWRM